MTGETYRRWAAGRCPCCGAEVEEWIDGTEPESIAEGVMICGRCVANDHLSDLAPGLRDAMLEAIVRRTDEPLDRVIDGIRS